MTDRLLLSGASAVLAGACVLAGLAGAVWWLVAVLLGAFVLAALLAAAAGAHDPLGYGLVAAVAFGAVLGLAAAATEDDPAWGAFLLCGALLAGAATAIRARHVDLGRRPVHAPMTGAALLDVAALACLATFVLARTPVGWCVAALVATTGSVAWELLTHGARTPLHVLRVWSRTLVSILFVAGVFLALETDMDWPAGWLLGSLAATPPLVAGWLLTAEPERPRRRPRRRRR